MYSVKDFIETEEGLVFAVVANETEQGRVLCFLRYVMVGSGWRKLSTARANALLQQKYPRYLFFSEVRDVALHAVSVDRISRWYRPRQRLVDIVRSNRPDPVEQDLIALYRLFREGGLNVDNMGVTGSLLIGAHNPDSDIDWVVYERQEFHRARHLTRELIGRRVLDNPDGADWEASYHRRACTLSLEEYVRHERRKYNKAMINGRKFDLSYVGNEPDVSEGFIKCGRAIIQCTVIDAERAYDYPALYRVDHPDIETVVSYTATYVGQAEAGEVVEVSGFLERSESGTMRIVVGSSREAEGEYIRVLG
ncbi:MAG: nucleotidyltransferase domain-containing protein [Gammaproteobacteria bacterium]